MACVVHIRLQCSAAHTQQTRRDASQPPNEPPWRKQRAKPSQASVRSQVSIDQLSDDPSMHCRLELPLSCSVTAVAVFWALLLLCDRARLIGAIQASSDRCIRDQLHRTVPLVGQFCLGFLIFLGFRRITRSVVNKDQYRRSLQSVSIDWPSILLPNDR